MGDGANHADKADIRKIALLVLIVLVSFGAFFGAFPARDGLHTFSLHDRDGTMSLDDVLAAPAGSWRDDEGRTFNAGYAEGTYWVKARLSAWSDGARLLVINFPLLEQITLYRQQKAGTRTAPVELGAAHPFGARLVPSTSYVVPLGAIDSESTVVVRVRTRSSMQVPLELWTADAFAEQQREVTLFHGAYLGVVVAMFLYNVLLYAVLREKAYVWYIGWMVSMALFVVTVNGLAFQWLWPARPGLSFTVVPMALAVAIACASRFFIQFLGEQGPGAVLFRFIVGGCLGIAGAALVLPFRISVIAAIGMAMFMVIAATLIAIRRSRQGHATAGYFLMAFCFVITGGVALALNKFGVVPRTFATEHAAELGSAIEMVVLSFALIARFNSQRRQRETAQLQLLQAEQMRTVELEARVRERTAELHAANAQLLALSRIDALTGMFNRRYLDERLQDELRRVDRARSSVAVLMIDVDHFKRLNDTHGHQAGDLCLQAVARAIMDGCVRPGDIAARFGGEEFMVLAPDIDAAGAEVLAEKLRQRIETLEIDAGAQTLRVTASIGVCWCQSEGSLSGEAMVAAADEALYRAKAAGRNRVVRA